MFENKIMVLTGGAVGIGKVIREAFEKEGGKVCIIDQKENPYFVGDLSLESHIRAFAQKVIDDFGRVDVLVNNALPLMKGLENGTWEEFNQALFVGVSAPFLLTQLFLPYFAPGASIVNVSSSRDRMSQPNTESYTAAKGGIAALTHAMAVTLAGKVRVNSVSPGWIDTTGSTFEGADALQHPVHRVGTPKDVADLVLFLASDRAGFIMGENICIDGGMTRQMIYHGDHGWAYNPNHGWQ